MTTTLSNSGWLDAGFDAKSEYDPASSPGFASLVASPRMSKGFTLLFAICNQPGDAYKLVDRLTSILGAGRVRHVDLQRRIDDLLTALQNDYNPEFTGCAAVSGLERHIRSDEQPDRNRMIVNLNHFRDRYPDEFPRPLLLLIPSYLLQAIAHGAPDFFSIHSGVFHFEPPPQAVRQRFGEFIDGAPLDWDGRSPEQRAEHLGRLDRLQRELTSRPFDQRDIFAEIDIALAISAQLEFQGDYRSAMQGLLELQNAADSALSAESPRGAIFRGATARLLLKAGRHGEAEPLMRRILALAERSLGPDHPNVATAQSNLASLLWTTSRLDEAEPLMRQALAIDQHSLGPGHPSVARDLNNLAQLLQATNRLGEAEPLVRRALAIAESSFGPDHPMVAAALNNLAQLLLATNRLGEAEPLMRRALAIDQRNFGLDHPSVARDLNNLAQSLLATNRFGEAEAPMRRQLEILLKFMRSTGHQHPHLQAAAANYAGLLKAMGRSDSQIQSALRQLAPELFPSPQPRTQ